jgi:hypothetical protein
VHTESDLRVFLQAIDSEVMRPGKSIKAPTGGHEKH